MCSCQRIESTQTMKWFYKVDFVDDSDLFNLNMFYIYTTVYSGDWLQSERDLVSRTLFVLELVEIYQILCSYIITVSDCSIHFCMWIPKYTKIPFLWLLCIDQDIVTYRLFISLLLTCLIAGRERIKEPGVKTSIY